MKNPKALILAVVYVLLAGPAFAHFPILIPSEPFETFRPQANSPVTFMFAFGHPYEQEYVASEEPERVFAVLPTGQQVELNGNLSQGTYTVDDLQADVWNITYTPEMTGDTILAVNSHPEIGLNNSMYQEYIKTVIPVEEQDGWDNRTGQPLEIVPLTRPYGLEAGYVFTGRLMQGDEPVAGAEIQIEEFLQHVPNPSDLPNEAFITQIVKTSPDGVFSYTLSDAAWWIIAAEVENLGTLERDGTTYNLSGLAALWLNVEEPYEQVFPSGIFLWPKK